MTNLLSIREQVRQFLNLLKKFGLSYLLKIALIFIAYYLNKTFFVYLLKLEIDNFDLYPSLYFWILLILNFIIILVITYYLYKLFISLIKKLSSQGDDKSKFFDIFSFASFSNFILVIYIILFFIYNFSSNFAVVDLYYKYQAVNSFESSYNTFIYSDYLSIFLILVLFLSSVNFFNIFRILNKDILCGRDFVKKIIKGAYWNLMLRISIFILIFLPLIYLLSFFIANLLSLAVILSFLLLFWISPIYQERINNIEIDKIKKLRFRKLNQVVYYSLLSIAILILFIINSFQLLNISAFKPTEVNNSDLLFNYGPIPANENAFVYFFDPEKIDSISTYKDNSNKSLKIINEDYWDQDYVDELISENRELLDHYIYAINNFSSWQNTENPCTSYEDRKIISLSLYRLASRLYNLQVLNYLNNNEIEKALEMALIEHNFIANIDQQHDIIDYLVILFQKKSNLTSLNKIISHREFSSIIVEAIINSNYLKKDMLEYALKSEYCKMYYSTKDIFNILGQVFSYYTGDCNNQIASHYRQFINSANSSNYFEALDLIPDELDYSFNYSVLYEKKSLCRLIASLPQSSFTDLIYRNAEIDTIYNLTVINLNWQRFKKENNRAPVSLEELNIDEKYLLDLVNGEMLSYDFENQIVWSAASNDRGDNAIVLDLNTGIIGAR